MRLNGMDYCLSDGAGGADIYRRPHPGHRRRRILDAIGLDLDADGHADDALADLDGPDGLADHAVHGLDGPAPVYFTDDGAGTWAVAVDRAGSCAGSVRTAPSPSAARWWISTVTVFRASGCSMSTPTGWPTGCSAPDRHTRPGRRRQWDVRLTDVDGDGTADTATDLS
jgi:hypothetical protein